MSEFIEHKTIDGERWDLLADRYYGNSLRYAVIVEANPNIPISPVLPESSVLKIPIIEENDSNIITEDLPPWRQ